MVTTLKSTCVGFNRLQTPLEKSHNIKNYYAILDVDDFFNLDNWLKTNVRDPKDRGTIPTQIWGSLNLKELFPFMNRGILLSIKDVRYDNQSNSIEIDMDDPVVHGLIDGGHTYLQVSKFKNSKEERQVDKQFVRVELISGLDKGKTVDIADGRNKSNQVKEVGLAELRGVFDDIKEALKDEPYAKDIAYKEFETYDDNPDEEKPISVIEILRCIVCLDKENFTEDKHPHSVVTRGGDKEVINHYRVNREKLKPLLQLLPEALSLWSTILERFVEVYNRQGGAAGKLGEKDDRFFKGLGKKSYNLYFKKGARRSYAFVDSLAYPVFASFRGAIKVNPKNKKYEWKKKINPSDFFSENVGPKITKVVCDSLKETKEVSKTVRADSVWVSCYDKMLISLNEVAD